MRKDFLGSPSRPRPKSVSLKLGIVVGLSWLILALALPVLGDVSPPEQAPGSNLDPNQATQVRMVSETVVIDIQPSEPNQDERTLADDRAKAQVTATFLMRNLGDNDETMQVRFPLESADSSATPPIEAFTVKVDGQTAITSTIYNKFGPRDRYINWAAFDVTFPAQQDVTLEVTYQTRPTGYLPAARFGYILETGAGWRDTIGSADIIVRLPYTATEENVLLGPNRTNEGAKYQTTPGGQFVDNEIRWHWDDLEPTDADNLSVNILVPQTWQQIVTARAAVDAQPDDANAWQTLAQAYEAAVTNDFPTESNDPYAALSERALARAAALSPDSPQRLTDLAQLQWDHLTVQAFLPATDPTLPSIINELHQALTLDPGYEPAQNLLAEVKSLVEGPLPPLQAWTVATNGDLFVLDADNIVHQLAPTDLTPKAQSRPLDLGTLSQETPVHLLADDNRLFVASQTQSQTLVLSQLDFFSLTTLDYAGPMALDPDKQLLMLSAQTNQLLAYDPTDLSQPPQSIELDCTPLDMAVDPASRLLYLHKDTSCGFSHHAEAYYLYDLETLTELSRVKSPFDSNYGLLAPPATLKTSELGVGAQIPDGMFPRLSTFDRQGQIVSKTDLPYWGDKAIALAADQEWIYARLKRGLAVLRADDLSLQSFLPFTTTVPTDLALSPDGKTLYLFGDQVTAHATAELQTLGIASVSPFPPAWTQPEAGVTQPTELRLYPSPDLEQDSTMFAHLLPDGDPLQAEIYRSNDGGDSWIALPVLTHQVSALSLSPDFATDRTLIAGSKRSTDAGETWEAWSRRLAFVSDRDGNREIYTMDGLGQDVQRLTENAADDENPTWSPAWTWLAFQSNRSGNWDIFSLQADCPATECALRQLTDDEADDMLPAWSPDGRRIAFVSTRDGNPEIYVMDKDGQNQQRLTFDPGGDWRPAWLPDSQRLVFTSDRSGNNDIYRLTVPSPENDPLTGEPPLTPLVTGPADDRDPAIGGYRLLSTYFDFDFGPSGYLFFLSDREGIQKTYVTTPDDTTVTAEPFAENDLAEAHPSWFNEYTLLVAAGQAEEADIYALTPFGAPKALTESPGFDGQPAGGPVWWLPKIRADGF